MNSARHILRVSVLKVLDWDFLIAVLPILFYGLWVFNYGGHTSYAYWKACCLDTVKGNFDGMINSIGADIPILASCYCVYLALKVRKILAQFTSFKSKFFYVQVIQIAVAIPSMFIIGALVVFFLLPHEWSSTNWGW
ncbi:MAG: hypothetical protein Q7U37_04315 [Gallionella sp.]|nr:hypothetical protein [Gallionella sp.]